MWLSQIGIHVRSIHIPRSCICPGVNMMYRSGLASWGVSTYEPTCRGTRTSAARLIFLLPEVKVSSICDELPSPLRCSLCHLLRSLLCGRCQIIQCINLACTRSGSLLHIVKRAPWSGPAVELFSWPLLFSTFGLSC